MKTSNIHSTFILKEQYGLFQLKNLNFTLNSVLESFKDKIKMTHVTCVV